MPRRVQSAEEATPPNGLVAAAARLAGPGVKKKKTPRPVNAEAWQNALWVYYDTVSELRFAANYIGNMISRAQLGVRYNGKIVTEGTGWEALQLLFGGPEFQPEMLRQWGVHATVAGECYIVGEDGGQDQEDRWWVAASTEMHSVGDGWQMGKKQLDDPLVMRLWKPHPRKFKEADSPARAVLPILAELDWLTKSVAADLASRVAGRGILKVPSEISFAGGPVTTNADGTATSPSANAMLLELMETMMTALEDPESAAAAVPVLFQGPAEFLDKMDHLTLSTDVQERAVALREEAIRRIGIGMDMPPEVLTGTGDMNHWGSWQNDEATIKIHTEPLLGILTRGLTEKYLRPYVADIDGDDEAAGWELFADTSGMRQRPNRSKEAIELYQMGELSAEAMRRENGFEELDAPNPIERQQFLIRQLAKGTTTPEAVHAAYELLGIPLPVAPAAESDSGVQDVPRNVTTEDHPVRELPEREDDPQLAAAVAAAEIMVHRALERAGNRMKGRGGTPFPAGVTAADFYQHRQPRDQQQLDAIMDGCWGFVGRFDYGLPHDRFVLALDTFTRGLLRTGRPYARDDLRRFIIAVRERESSSPRAVAATMSVQERTR